MVVAREQAALAERMEQCIDMAANITATPTIGAWSEPGPEQVMAKSPMHEMSKVERARNGACLLQVRVFVDERRVMFLRHGASFRALEAPHWVLCHAPTDDV
jgi:hypothetical protein